MQWKHRTALAVLFCAAGCGSDGSDGQQQSAPVECGTLTCSGTEMCVVPRAIDPWFEGPESHACEPIPAGCEGLRLCSCPALEEDYHGLVIIGCSLLGERSIYVGDVTCGDRRCVNEEFCLIETQGFGGPTISRECRSVPAACQAGSKFCGENGCMSETSVDNRPVIGCLESPSVRAINVDAG